MLKWIWCGSEGNYDDFCLWDICDKQFLNTSAKFELQLYNVEYIRYYELFSYCYMYFISFWLRN